MILQHSHLHHFCHEVQRDHENQQLPVMRWQRGKKNQLISSKVISKLCETVLTKNTYSLSGLSRLTSMSLESLRSLFIHGKRNKRMSYLCFKCHIYSQDICKIISVISELIITLNHSIVFTFLLKQNQIYICNPVKKIKTLTGAPGGPAGPLGPVKPWESESESKHECDQYDQQWFSYYDQCWPILNKRSNL